MATSEEHKDEHAAKKNLGAAWADQMRNRYENISNDREKMVDHRVEDAQAFIGREVTKMKVPPFIAPLVPARLSPE